jgi:hypothetical protein
MGILGKLLKMEQSLRNRVENVFGSEATRTQEIRREILEQVQSRIAADTSGNRFPYAKTIVRLRPPTEALRNAFAAAFLQEGTLKADILELLKSAKARHPERLDVIVAFSGDAPPGSEPASPGLMFQLEFVKQDPSIEKALPETSFVISKGTAEQQSYRLTKKSILIGRSLEVLDREGRVVRKNDIVFLDNGDDINSSVDRAHARISFDFEKDGFFIIDEVSRFGTIVMREGRSIEVPEGVPRGIRLRSGDAIYCGRACLRLEFRNSG